MPSTHFRLPRRTEKGEIHVNILHPPKYFFYMQITPPNGPNSRNERPAANIDNVLFIEHVIQSPPMQSILSRPRWHAEKGR